MATPTAGVERPKHDLLKALPWAWSLTQSRSSAFPSNTSFYTNKFQSANNKQFACRFCFFLHQSAAFRRSSARSLASLCMQHAVASPSSATNLAIMTPLKCHPSIQMCFLSALIGKLSFAWGLTRPPLRAWKILNFGCGFSLAANQAVFEIKNFSFAFFGSQKVCVFLSQHANIRGLWKIFLWLHIWMNTLS